jgi:alcohol dehydrogenase (cytochrome c)
VKAAARKEKRSRAWLAVLAAVVLAYGLAGCGGDDEQAAGTTVAKAGDATSLAAEEWGTFGYSYDQNRHVPHAEITKENVSDLGRAFTVDFKAEDPTIPLGQQSYPLAIGGTLYVTTAFNHMFAVDGKTGTVKWHFKPSKIGPFKNFGLNTNRGLAYCDGKLYMLTLDMRIISVDAATGTLAKEVFIYDAVKDAKPEFGYYETTAPVCYQGTLLVGSSGSDNGVRGFFMGYNTDLTPAWANPYWTVPPEGQGWRSQGRFHGGGTNWMPPAIDEETGIAYFSTANPSPDFFADLRPGTNPKTNSVIAVDVKTGVEKWWRQQLGPDEWDYDTAQPPQVYTAKVDGADKKVVSVATKEGVWFAYDAGTGEPLYERVKLLDRIDHPRLQRGKPVTIYPSAGGGVNFSPASYDPTTNYVINGAVESATVLTQVESAMEVYKDRVRGDVDTGTVNGFGTTPKGWHDAGSVTAIDLNTGKIAWKFKTPEPERGGITTTASGLGFVGGGDGTLRAFDTSTGDILWKFQTGNQIASGVTSYMIDGKQYLAITVGGTFTSSHGGTASRLEVYALGADKTQSAPPKIAPDVSARQGEAPPTKYLSLGSEPKTLGLQVLAAQGAAGGGLNFNGFNRGGMTVTIPQGYTVNVTFKNLSSNSPHSARVTSIDAIKEVQAGTVPPAFPGASTKQPEAGITSGTQYFDFVADKPGTYALLCGIAGHAIGGQWNYVKVVGANAKPSIKLGNETFTLDGSK